MLSVYNWKCLELIQSSHFSSLLLRLLLVTYRFWSAVPKINLVRFYCIKIPLIGKTFFPFYVKKPMSVLFNNKNTVYSKLGFRFRMIRTFLCLILICEQKHSNYLTKTVLQLLYITAESGYNGSNGCEKRCLFYWYNRIQE